MVRLFDIKDGKVIPTEHCYILSTLKAVMEKFPEDYISVYTYLYYSTAPDPENNPFFDVKNEDREELIMKEVKGTFSLEDPVVMAARKLCITMYDTAISRAFIGIQTMLDNMSEAMKKKITFGKDGNAQSLISFAKDFQRIRDNYKGAQKDLLEEQNNARARGGQQLSYDSK